MKVRSIALVVAASVAGLSLVMAGCGGEEPAPEPAQRAAAPAEPQPDPVPQEIHDTFEAASQALAQGDYATYSRMLTPEAQERMAGNLAMTGAVLKQQVASTQALSALTEQFGGGDEEESAGAELERVVQVLEKHGVADIDPVSLLGSGGQASGSALVAASIEDKPAFIGEMLDAVMAVQAKAGLQTGQQIAPPAPGELTNVMVDGDTAAGLVAHTINGQERKTPITFRKVGDDWKIDESAH